MFVFTGLDVGERETGKTSAARFLAAPAAGTFNLEIDNRRKLTGDSIKKQVISG